MEKKNVVRTFEMTDTWRDYAVVPMEEALGYPAPTSLVGGGTKHDEGKVDYTLISTPGLEAEALALMFGERKYGRYNYTKGLEANRLVAASLRHIIAYRDGVDNDPESGIHHLGHARACLGMLLHCDKLGTLRDDRYKGKK